MGFEPMRPLERPAGLANRSFQPLTQLSVTMREDRGSAAVGAIDSAVPEFWRSDGDSNPGDGLPSTDFPGQRLRPLGHRSATFRRRNRRHSEFPQWRRARDSNPGDPCGSSAFRVQCIRPLCQLSVPCRPCRRLAEPLRIRTQGRLAPPPVFKTGALDRSAMVPSSIIQTQTDYLIF